MAIIIDPMASLTLGQTVGNLISSLVEAQAQAARSTVDFINEVGFHETKQPGEVPGLRTVEFTYRKRDENNRESEFQVSLPLLGMVDIPLIAIRRATIDLEFEVNSVEKPSRPLDNESGVGKFSSIIKGHVLTGRQPAVDQRGTIKVSVEVEKADLPPGLARSLDILEIAAREAPLPGQPG